MVKAGLGRGIGPGWNSVHGRGPLPARTGGRFQRAHGTDVQLATGELIGPCGGVGGIAPGPLAHDGKEGLVALVPG
jgi:hypothetical protein